MGSSMFSATGRIACDSIAPPRRFAEMSGMVWPSSTSKRFSLCFFLKDRVNSGTKAPSAARSMTTSASMPMTMPMRGGTAVAAAQMLMNSFSDSLIPLPSMCLRATSRSSARMLWDFLLEPSSSSW